MEFGSTTALEIQSQELRIGHLKTEIPTNNVFYRALAKRSMLTYIAFHISFRLRFWNSVGNKLYMLLLCLNLCPFVPTVLVKLETNKINAF